MELVNVPVESSSVLFVRGMWMRRGNDTLAALLYGPCRVSAHIAGVPVDIEEQTAYPFGDTVALTVHPRSDVEFSILPRDPAWSRNTAIRCADADISQEGGYWRVTKKWTAGDAVQIRFHREVRQLTAVNGEVALEYGALLFARPVPSTSTVLRTYPLPALRTPAMNPPSASRKT